MCPLLGCFAMQGRLRLLELAAALLCGIALPLLHVCRMFMVLQDFYIKTWPELGPHVRTKHDRACADTIYIRLHHETVCAYSVVTKLVVCMGSQQKRFKKLTASNCGSGTEMTKCWRSSGWLWEAARTKQRLRAEATRGLTALPICVYRSTRAALRTWLLKT